LIVHAENRSVGIESSVDGPEDVQVVERDDGELDVLLSERKQIEYVEIAKLMLKK
jgi:hypothetical protein